MEHIMNKKWYKRFASNTLLPIEVMVNTILLYTYHRRIVQFDMSYYDSSITKKTIEEFSQLLKNTIQHYDDTGNIILYLRKRKSSTEKKLLKISIDGSIRGAFKTVKYARFLDKQFYICNESIRDTKTSANLVRVAIEVIAPDSGRIGAILVCMCSRSSLHDKIQQIYKRFIDLTEILEAFKCDFQTQLCVYTKSGMWDASPEYVNRLFELS